MRQSADVVLAEVTAGLRGSLGNNLYSCCVYGSAVRGNAVEGVSDINLLIVLDESTAQAHEQISRAITSHALIDPFVLGRTGLARTARCFATKFASIRRNYRVLHGADPFVGIKFSAEFERFLCEQAVRNLRLRLTYAFIVRDRQQYYGRFLAKSVSAIFIQLGDVLRLSGVDVPKDFAARIPIMGRSWGTEEAILQELLKLRAQPGSLAESEIPDWHQRVLTLLDSALAAIERSWTDMSGGDA
jgi:hypothetical protein